MSLLLKVLAEASHSSPSAPAPELVLRLAVASGDPDAIASVVGGTAAPAPELIAALITAESSPKALQVAVDAANRGMLAAADAPDAPDASVALLTRVGPAAARHLLTTAGYAAESRYAGHPDMAATLALLRTGLPGTLATVEDDLVAWVELAKDAAEWRIGRAGESSLDSGSLEGRWCRSNPEGDLEALAAWALANPSCDRAVVAAVVAAVPRDAEPAVLTPVLARTDETVLRTVAESRTASGWLLPAAVLAGSTDWIPAAEMIAQAVVHPAVRDHVAAACATLDATELAAVTALADRWDGTFDELVATATAVSS